MRCRTGAMCRSSDVRSIRGAPQVVETKSLARSLFALNPAHPSATAVRGDSFFGESYV